MHNEKTNIFNLYERTSWDPGCPLDEIWGIDRKSIPCFISKFRYPNSLSLFHRGDVGFRDRLHFLSGPVQLIRIASELGEIRPAAGGTVLWLFSNADRGTSIFHPWTAVYKATGRASQYHQPYPGLSYFFLSGHYQSIPEPDQEKDTAITILSFLTIGSRRAESKRRQMPNTRPGYWRPWMGCVPAG